MVFVKQVRQLKAEDVAFGIGAPYSDDELNAFLKEDESDQISFDLISSIEEIKCKLRN